jgi:hypothetical protein
MAIRWCVGGRPLDLAKRSLYRSSNSSMTSTITLASMARVVRDAAVDQRIQRLLCMKANVCWWKS